MPDSEPTYPHEPDHVIARKHGGRTTYANLAYACFECNRAKGSDIASYDSLTGDLTPLYNPRQQSWSEHFRFKDGEIEPLIAIGRVTVALLKLNAPARITIRENLMDAGVYRMPK